MTVEQGASYASCLGIKCDLEEFARIPEEFYPKKKNPGSWKRRVAGASAHRHQECDHIKAMDRGVRFTAYLQGLDRCLGKGKYGARGRLRES